MKKKLLLNTFFSLLLQLVTVVCGFILPRLFLTEYGSDVNGLVQSISQFLGIITMLELGVGQVIQSALYKPIATNDKETLSSVIASGSAFFKRIAYILGIYVIVLVFVFPVIIDKDYEWYYTASLIITISLSSFAQYYFGIIDRILLNADQKGYVQYISQIIAIFVNTLLSVVFIKSGYSIQVVKLVSAIVYLLRPFLVRIYVNKKYNIDRKTKYTGEPIKQKWNGIAQHVSGFILNGTDNVVLTLFSTLSNVSIYAVYHLVIYGVHQIYVSATAGLHSIVGDLLAKNDTVKLHRIYGYIETGLHFSTVFLFSCTGILLIPFIRVYTKGITDANYIQPLFGVLLVLAHASQCIKTTYNMVILGGGHYKQTQKCHIISAVLNVVISILSVHQWGLIGVTIGTVVSMCYQAVWMAWYDSKNLIKWPFHNFIKQIAVDFLAVVIIVTATSWIRLTELSYLSWFIMAIEVATVAFFVIIIVGFIFYKERLYAIVNAIFSRKKINNN